MMHVAILALPGVQLLDVVGPSDAFSEANGLLGHCYYQIEVVGQSRGPVKGSSGLMLVAGRSIHEPVEPVDILLVAGGPLIQEQPVPEDVVRWVKATAEVSARYGSVCAGAFVLAETGLLDGRRVTTHWSQAAEFARRFPKVKLEPDRIFTTDGPVWTSAGVTAGIDLALALVEQDVGLDTALAVARKLVVFLKRPGGQSQFSSHLVAQIAQKAPIKAIQDHVLENVADKLDLAELSGRAGMSIRNFARLFRQDTGMTPAEFVERVRLDEAKRLLDDPATPMQRVAQLAGFRDMIRMRRAFLRTIGVTPGAYRRSFGRTSPDLSPL
jgi:transcriptional regulator GlxA family with amidase domain